ncbi:unnamed protein product, partial [Choristocarpus tenellus]
MLFQHNTDILAKVVLEDGSVLRAKTNALPTMDSLFRDPQQPNGGLLKLWAENPLPGIVGTFNIRGASYSQDKRTWVALEEEGQVPSVAGVLRPHDVHAFASGGNTYASTSPQNRQCSHEKGGCTSESWKGGTDTYVVYLHQAGEVHILQSLGALHQDVPHLGFELATVSRVVVLPSLEDGTAKVGKHRDQVRWAVVGLVDMFNSAAAVTAQELLIKVSQGGSTVPGVSMLVKGSGRFQGVASKAPKSVTLG